MAAVNFDALADQILERVGGSTNITYLAYCMTRLRMTLKDRELVDVDSIKALDGVKGAQWSGEQFQVIIGQKVPDLYAIVRKKGNLENADGQNTEAGRKPGEKLTLKSVGGSILDGLSGSLAPLIPLLIAGGSYLRYHRCNRRYFRAGYLRCLLTGTHTAHRFYDREWGRWSNRRINGLQNVLLHCSSMRSIQASCHLGPC